MKVDNRKPEITEIMTYFHDTTGIKPIPEFRQRQYCKHLLDLYKDNTMDLVKYALSIQKDYYAPQVLSPKDLYYKHDRVMAYHLKNESQANNNVRRAG